MINALAIMRQLTDAGIDRAHADAITDAVRQAAEHGDHVTPDAFTAGVAEIRTEIAEVRTEMRTGLADVRTAISGVRADLTWRLLAVAGLVIAALRLLG